MEPQWKKVSNLRKQQKLIRDATQLANTLKLKLEEMKHKHVKQSIARGINVLQDLMVKLDPAMKPEQAEWQKKALAIFAKQNDAIVQASAAEMREAGANEALIDDMVSQLRKELEPDEPENGDEDETAPRAQPFPMSAVPGWQEVLGCDGMRLFEEQDLEGTFKPEEIVLDNISMQNFEGGRTSFSNSFHHQHDANCCSEPRWTQRRSRRKLRQQAEKETVQRHGGSPFL